MEVKGDGFHQKNVFKTCELCFGRDCYLIDRRRAFEHIIIANLAFAGFTYDGFATRARVVSRLQIFVDRLSREDHIQISRGPT